MSSRLTKNSRAVSVLREKFEDGTVTGDETPKAVWSSDPIFQVHSLNAFRTCFNSMKAENKSGNGKCFIPFFILLRNFFYQICIIL